jgi:hypothetical protein
LDHDQLIEMVTKRRVGGEATLN